MFTGIKTALRLLLAVLALTLVVGQGTQAPLGDDAWNDDFSGDYYNYGEDDDYPGIRQVAPVTVCNLQCPNGQQCSIGNNGTPFCRVTKSGTGHPCVPNPCPPGVRCTVKPNWQSKADHTCGDANFCATITCLNGGVCESALRVCMCINGYSGTNCEIYGSADPCSPNPCLNGASCRVQSNRFICNCIGGYSGNTCNVAPVINPCIPNPCLNGGVCNQQGTSYLCNCRNLYTGPLCNTAPPLNNPCVPSPCLNNGICEQLPTGGLSCRCVGGYTGINCNTPPTRSCPCLNGGKCAGGSGGSFQCSCAPGYSGTICETSIVTPVNPCSTNPCLNGGLCYTSASGTAACNCQNRYSGSLCEISPSRCAPNPCFNGGVCTETSYSYSCACVNGYSGTLCDQQSNPCTTNPCQNNGICTNHGTYRSCNCQFGFSGTNCEVSPAPNCQVDICRNGGTCRSHGTHVTCDCLPNYTGVTCEISQRKPTYCQPSPCLNGGTCHNGANGYICVCLPNFQGPTCHLPLVAQPCARIPCKNNGVCTNIGGTTGYKCSCKFGFTGSNCETKAPDVCLTQPCQNGATCIKLSATQRSCQCTNGFIGPDCGTKQSSSGACAVNPCKGDCTCQKSCRHASGYFCHSKSGYLGKNCLVPPPTIVCGNNAITIRISSAFPLEYTSTLNKFKIAVSKTPSGVQPNECKAVLTGSEYIISIPSPFTSCGNTIAPGTQGEKTVSNNVFMTLAQSVGFDIPVPIVNFNCVYKKQYNVISSIKPQMDAVVPQVSSIGSKKALASMNLCKVGTCPSTCSQQYSVTNGAIYTVGELIHLSIAAPVQANMNLAVHEVFLSCKPDVAITSATAPVALVDGGCLASTKTNYMPTTLSQNAVGGKICLSFQVPKLLGTGCDLVYIHAKLRHCSPSGVKTCASGGTKFCDVTSRRRRSAEIAYQVLGPIYILSKENTGSTLLFPGTDLVNATGVLDDIGDILDIEDMTNLRPKTFNSNYLTFAAYIVVIVILCIVCVVAIGCILKQLFLHRASKK